MPAVQVVPIVGEPPARGSAAGPGGRLVRRLPADPIGRLAPASTFPAAIPGATRTPLRHRLKLVMLTSPGAIMPSRRRLADWSPW